MGAAKDQLDRIVAVEALERPCIQIDPDVRECRSLALHDRTSPKMRLDLWGRPLGGHTQDYGGSADLRGDQHRRGNPPGLHGAGGLRDPIVTGLQLNDAGLILSGAVPAAFLALLAASLLGHAERGLTASGLA